MCYAGCSAVVLAALVLVPVGRRRTRARARRRQDARRICGTTAPLVERQANALDALEAASGLGEFYYHVQRTSFGPYVDQIGALPRRRPDRLGLQGERQVAAGRRRRGVAEGGRHGALVLGDVRRRRRAEDARARARAGRRAATACTRQDDNGARAAAVGAVLHVGRSRTVQTQGATQAAVGCAGKHRGLVRATLAGAVRSNALRETARAARSPSFSPAAAGSGGSATLWVTRDRGGTCSWSRSVPAGLTAMQALERKADVKTSYGGRFVDSIDGVASAPRRDWFYFVNGKPATAAPPSAAARRRRRLGGHSDAVQAVVGAFPNRSCADPAVVVGTGRAAKLARLVHGRSRERLLGRIRARAPRRQRLPRARRAPVRHRPRARRARRGSVRVQVPLRGAP